MKIKEKLGNIASSISVLAAFTTLTKIDIFQKLFVYVVDTIPIWGTAILILFLGIGLYLFRERYRIVYGVFEFCFGFFCVILPIFERGFNYSEMNFEIHILLRFVAGLYIMVRGQDNIVKGLKDKKWATNFLRKLKLEK